MADELLSTIGDPGTGEPELAAAIEKLPPGAEPASFWLDIASDSRYGVNHRRRAVVELFRRHVPPGTTLGELGGLLAGAEWLRDEDIAVVGAVAGKIPVSWTFDDTVFVLILLPDDDADSTAVYLRVGGKVSPDDFIAVIRGRGGAEDAAAAPILEVGWSLG